MNISSHERNGVSMSNCDLDNLYMQKLPMTVPLLGNVILIGSRDEKDSDTTLILDVDTPHEHVSIYRRDGLPIQIRSSEPDMTHSELLAFHDDIEQLQIEKIHDEWHAKVDMGNIRNPATIRSFIGIAAFRATVKQYDREQAISQFVV